MRKGRKMPDVRIEGTSEQEFELVDGKIRPKRKDPGNA